MKRWIARLMLLVAALPLLGAGQEETRTFVLFGGSDVDSTEQVSPWIPVRGANRILIRTWSGKAAFHDEEDPDSTFSDSIQTFRVAFTDSVKSTNPLVGADSVVVNAVSLTVLDTTSKMVAVHSPPLQEALRGPGNGSGIYTQVTPTIPGGVGVYGDGSIAPQYMRVLITPLRRNTVTGGQSTEGKRVNGLKGLRMQALVIYKNK